MKHTLIVCLALIASAANAQDFFMSVAPPTAQKKTVNLPDKPNVTDANGLKQGEWAKKYENGRYAYVATFKDGKPQGTVVRYHENGKKSSEQTYGDNGECYVVLYSDSEKKEAEGKFVNEKREGEWKFYANDGTVIMVQTYTAGLVTGTERAYYETGELMRETEYKEGLPYGFTVEYYKRGAKKCISYYSKGIQQGDYKLWDEGGKVMIEGKYKDDLKVGQWRIYDDDENEYFTMEYNSKGELTNQAEIDERMAKKYEKQDALRLQLQDPQEYIQNPEEYRP